MASIKLNFGLKWPKLTLHTKDYIQHVLLLELERPSRKNHCKIHKTQGELVDSEEDPQKKKENRKLSSGTARVLQTKDKDKSLDNEINM